MASTSVNVRTMRSACPLDCPDGCSLEVTVEDGRVTKIDAGAAKPDTDGYICGKVRSGMPRHLYHAKRVTTPLVREKGARKGEGRFRPVSWEEALERVARELAAARRRTGGESILPFSYGGSNGLFTQDTSDAALFRRLGASQLLRTVCAVPTGVAAKGMYGSMVGITPRDFEEAQAIVVWGANPHVSGIHLVRHVQNAKARGAKLMVVDPRRTKLARQADLHLAPRPGTDLPLALAVLRWFFTEGRADRAFLDENALEVGELEERCQPWTLERAAEVCGLSPDAIEAFARTYADASPAALRCGWGQERNRNGGSATCAILALPAVAGKFGVRGGGYLLSNSRAYSFGSPSTDPPQETRAINMNELGRVLLEEKRPPIEVLFVYNANPVTTLPDQERVMRGLARAELFTVVFDQVLTNTAEYADVVLPATTFLEHHELSKGYGALSVQLGQPAIDPVGEARPNYTVFAELLERLELQRDEDDFTATGLLKSFVPDDEARQALEGGESLGSPHGERPVQYVDLEPRTPDGKIHLVPEALDREAPRGLYHYFEEAGDPAYPLALISPATERTISTMFGQLIEKEVPLAMHPDDAAARDLAAGDRVRVFNPLGQVVTGLVLDEAMKPGVVYLPKGIWNHSTRNGRTSNTLVPDSLTDLGGGACFNDARVQVERA